MGYELTKADVANLEYVMKAVEAETGDAFGEDECNGKRCVKRCGERKCCLLRSRTMLGKLIGKAKGKSKA